MKRLSIIQLFLYIILLNIGSFAQSNSVKLSGALSNVMRKGLLEGTIYLDTIQNKNNLYGLGPKEYLKGEIIVIDGESFVSSVQNEGSIRVDKTFEVKAPFFVYSTVSAWEELTMPEPIQTLKDLELFIDQSTLNHKRPFTFRLAGTFKSVDFHIQNLPAGTIVQSPDDAHKGQQKYHQKNMKGEVVGFFSTQHQSVFTHHDSFIHTHIISDDKNQAGHVDNLNFDNRAVRLFISK